jgi:hypothetical protein
MGKTDFLLWTERADSDASKTCVAFRDAGCEKILGHYRTLPTPQTAKTLYIQRHRVGAVIALPLLRVTYGE